MFYKKDGIKIYYEIKGTGTPIILLHGWGTSLDTFMHITDELMTSHKIYLIDLPSFGHSKEPSLPLSIPELAEILESFINDLKIVNPIILGHSYGGRVAIEYSSKSDNIKSLILVDSAGIKHNSIIKKIKVLTYKLKKTYYRLTKQIMKYQELTKMSGSIDYKMASPIQKQMLIKAVNYDQTKRLKKIKCETLIIFGKEDKITPLKDAYIFKRKIKRSGLVIIPKAGHFPYLENSYYFLKVITSYLGGKTKWNISYLFP